MSTSMMGKPAQRTDFTFDDDFLKDRWKTHVSESFKVRKEKEDDLVALILVRSGADNSILTKEDIWIVYVKIKHLKKVKFQELDDKEKLKYDPDYKRILIVDEFCKYIEDWGLEDQDSPSKQRQLAEAEESLSETLNTRLRGNKYEHMSKIGQDYLQFKHPDDEDFIVSEWAKHLRMLADKQHEMSLDEQREREETVLSSIM